MEILKKYIMFVELKYYPRLFVVTALSIVNSCLGIIEDILYADAISKVELPDNPIFILGNQRTGTTLLHNLLGSDVKNFYYCNTFCAGFPSSFLWFEKYGKYLFSSVLDKHRPMDSMTLDFDLPQEDELATNVLSGGISYYMPITFMQQEKIFRKYLDFSKEDGGSPDDEKQWCDAFLHLLKKVHLRELMQSHHAPSSSSSPIAPMRRLVIKSPVHTAKVPLLRKLFPNAHFIYIHRHPLAILSSCAHMADTAYWFTYMNTPTDDEVSDFIIWQFEQLWVKYDRAVAHYDPMSNRRNVDKDVLEVGYSDLATNTLDTMEKIYKHVNVNWSTMDMHYMQEIKSKSNYQPNKQSVINDHANRAILESRALERYCDAFGYRSVE